MAEQAEREEQARRWRFEVDLMWGGLPPTERLRTVGGNKLALAEMDRALLDAMAEATPRAQRDIARWAARRACDHAGLSSLGWVRPALDALEREEALPAPFEDQRRVWDLLLGENVQLQAVVATTEEPAPRMWPPAAALPTLFAAVELDPLHAAIDAVVGAARSPSATSTRSCSVSSGTPFRWLAARATCRRSIKGECDVTRSARSIKAQPRCALLSISRLAWLTRRGCHRTTLHPAGAKCPPTPDGWAVRRLPPTPHRRLQAGQPEVATTAAPVTPRPSPAASSPE